MKKILSVALALVMLMAITVPAFAADTEQSITQDTAAPQEATVDVVTTFTEENWEYIVTIPADISVDWNDTTEKPMTYSLKSNLLIGATLDISVATDGVMTASGTTDTLTLTLTGGEVKNFGAVNPENTTAPNVVGGTNAVVSVGGFANAAVGTYTGTLTYTVVYNAPVAP